MPFHTIVGFARSISPFLSNTSSIALKFASLSTVLYPLTTLLALWISNKMQQIFKIRRQNPIRVPLESYDKEKALK